MLEFRTPGFKGFGVKFSPFYDSRLAVATGQNFGLVGNGRLYIAGLTDRGIVQEKYFETRDSLYDLAWSEANEHQVYVGSGDGTIKLFDINQDAFPIAEWHDHGREVQSVHCNPISKTSFLSASWDGSIKLYDPSKAVAVLSIPTQSQTCVYSAQFSPHDDGLISSVGFDNHVRLFDVRVHPGHKQFCVLDKQVAEMRPMQAGVAPQTVKPPEALTHDWNKYRPTVIATAGTDKTIRVFDLRNMGGGPLDQQPATPVSAMVGHQYAIRRIAWSPHLSDIILSGSYDMTARVWSDGSINDAGQSIITPDESIAYFAARQVGGMNAHTEFVMGMDWCLFGAEGWCATTAWDERTLVWDVRACMV